jgi:hypothetical protein
MKNRIILILHSISLISDASYSQVNITPNVTAAQLLSYITGPNVTVSNPVLTCPPPASGLFNVVTSNLGLDSGIVLTSGHAISVSGNQSVFASNANNTAGDPLLTAAIGANTFDACKFEFDFSSIYDTVLFYYVFGSEEYQGYSCASFNDAFAYYISGPGFPSATNIALIPGTTIPVAINSTTNPAVTNPSSLALCNAMGPGSPFAQYYVNNTTGTSISYYGFTTIFEAKAPVSIGQQYHMTFVIADVGDAILDAGVFIRGSSFTCKPAITNSVSGIKKGSFTIHPNPFTDFINVELPAVFNEENLSVRLVNAIGQYVYEFKGTGNGLNSSLKDVAGKLQPGLFFITIEVPGKKIVESYKVQKL